MTCFCYSTERTKPGSSAGSDLSALLLLHHVHLAWPGPSSLLAQGFGSSLCALSPSSVIPWAGTHGTPKGQGWCQAPSPAACPPSQHRVMPEARELEAATTATCSRSNILERRGKERKGFFFWVTERSFLFVISRRTSAGSLLGHLHFCSLDSWAVCLP